MNKVIVLLSVIILVFQNPIYAKAETIDVQNIYDQFDFDNIQTEMNKITIDYEIELKEMFSLILEGKIGECFSKLLELLGTALLQQFGDLKYLFVSILSLGIISALFTNFAGMISNHQITDISFYFTYLLLISILMNSFSGAAEIMEQAIQNVLLFMKLFIPTYFVAMGLGSGITTATVYGNFLLFFIYFLEIIIKNLALPATYVYIFFNILNGLWIDEKLTSFVELIKKGIKFLFKGILTIVTGIGILQSMITPVIDSLKTSAVQKAVSAIPGIGNITNGVTEMVIGSAVLVKNSVGILMMLGLLFVCAIPLLKIFLISAVIKLGAAFIGIVGDKRITNCTDRIGDGGFLLLQACITSVTLFIITIAIVSCTANRGF